jgi:hypothetical protein
MNVNVDLRKVTIGLDRFGKLAKMKMRAFVIEFIQDLGEQCVRDTPVRTGFLRASWHASFDAPAAIILDVAASAGLGRSGDAAISAMNLAVAKLQFGQTLYFTNGAAYAVHVHDGTQHMHPRPWVTAVMDRAPQIAEAAARRVGSRS